MRKIIFPSMNSLLTEYPIMKDLGEIDQLLNLPDDEAQKESPRKISSLLQRMEALFSQMGEILDDSVSFRAPTSLKWIHNDLQQLKDILELYRYKSRLYKIVHCRASNELLMAMVNKFEHSLGAVACGLPQDSELCKGFNDLASEMKGTQLKASDMEELICRSIDEELNKGENDCSVNDTLIINLSRELRMASRNDLSQFSSEIDLYRSDAEYFRSPRDSDIADVLEKLFRNLTIEPHEAATLQRAPASAEIEEFPVPAYKTFFCPLGGEVMRNPVLLVETWQTYERQEIEKWFKCCAVEGRQPTCPMTGQALRSTAWRNNRDLQKTIEEWRDMNLSFVITRTKDRLSSNPSPQEFEKAVDEVSRISEESMHYRDILRNAGIIPLLLGPWDRPLENEHSVRSKVLDTLRSMASRNEENKLEMAHKNVVRLAVKSLTGNQEQERESAVLLLRELSLQPEVCAKIVQQKGAILLLSGFISNGGNPNLSNVANEIMRNMQGDQSNVITMAQAGHLEPLLECLSKGPSDVKLQMFSHLSHMTLSNNDKEMVIKKAGPSLIEVLSCDNADKDVALKTLLMLSSPAHNAPALINLGCLPPLFSVLSSDIPNAGLNEKVAEIFVNLLSKAGHWESYPIASDGTTLQSELAIHCFLRLLNRMNLQWKSNLLRILFYIAWSPQAAATQHIESGNGIFILNACLGQSESDSEVNLQALNVLGVLSLQGSSKVADELRRIDRFAYVKEHLKGSDPERQAAAAFIFANILLSEREVVEVLGIDLIPWIISELDTSKSSQIRKGGAAGFTFIEALIGLLLQFCKGSEILILQAVMNHRVMVVLRDNMVLSSQPSVKKLAAKGLQMLSEKAPTQADVEPEASRPQCCFALFPKREQLPQATCHVHGIVCEERTTLCLVRMKAVQPLVDLLEVDDMSVQIAALDALSTLLRDSLSLKSALEELEKAHGIKHIIELFCKGHTSAELQDKLVWMIERVTRVGDMCQKQAVNEVLNRTLVEVFRATRNPTTRELSREALTHLRQISGMTNRRE